jgi:hypothetical protein
MAELAVVAALTHFQYTVWPAVTDAVLVLSVNPWLALDDSGTVSTTLVSEPLTTSVHVRAPDAG